MYNIENFYEAEEYIRKVFNYYNGRINIFNYANIDIDWINHSNSMVGGYTQNPGIVTIYPKIICRFANSKSDLKWLIVMIIIHELYHVDQVRYTSLLDDVNYVKMIEDTVEFQTYSYILNNLNEIESLFVSDIRSVIDIEYANFLINNDYSNGYLYQRMKYDDYLCCIVDDIVRGTCVDLKSIFDAIRKCYNDGYDINISMTNDQGNNELCVRHNNNGIMENIDVRTLNAFLYNTYFKHFYRTNIAFNMTIEPNKVLLLRVSFNGFSYIATKI